MNSVNVIAPRPALAVPIATYIYSLCFIVVVAVIAAFAAFRYYEISLKARIENSAESPQFQK